MEKVHSVCNRCGDRHCCRGICKEMNNYLANKNKKNGSKHNAR